MPGAWGASTCKGDSIYLFVTHWPDDGPLLLPPIEQRIVRSRALGGAKTVVGQSESGIFINVAKADRDEIATVIVLTVDGDATAIRPVKVP